MIPYAFVPTRILGTSLRSHQPWPHWNIPSFCLKTLKNKSQFYPHVTQQYFRTAESVRRTWSRTNFSIISYEDRPLTMHVPTNWFPDFLNGICNSDFRLLFAPFNWTILFTNFGIYLVNFRLKSPFNYTVPTSTLTSSNFFVTTEIDCCQSLYCRTFDCSLLTYFEFVAKTIYFLITMITVLINAIKFSNNLFLHCPCSVTSLSLPFQYIQ